MKNDPHDYDPDAIAESRQELTAEQKRVLDDMLKRRLDARGETDSEREAVQQILALVSGVPDDTSMLVDTNRTKVDARTIRVWASFYLTPIAGTKQ